MDELAGTESVNIDLRIFGFDVPEEIEIPLLRQLRMMSALHEDLCAAKRNCFLNFFVHLAQSNDVSIVVLFRAIEGAELADRKSTRLNSSHRCISYAVFC